MNHLIKNIITKGWLNISALTKGIILPFFKYQIIKRKTGGNSPDVILQSGYNEENLVKDLKTLQEDDVIIKIFVDWDKKSNKKHKKITADLIRKKIEAKLLEYKIIVEKINIE